MQIIPQNLAKKLAPVASKVPEITLIFWIIKILTTAMGEATSDYMATHMNTYIAVVLGALGFMIALVLQFLVKIYIPWVYWLLVVMVSIFGTMAADAVHIALGVPYLISTIAFAASLVVILFLWHKTEGTLSIHSIYITRREMFYWATVMATFALGTAAGDMTAATLHLGFLISGFVFTTLFVLPGILFLAFGLNDILAFWASYVMTRPMGASFADWADKPVSIGGLNYGDGVVSLVLTALILVLVVRISFTHRSMQIRNAALDAEY